jgi:hypothetical protein
MLMKAIPAGPVSVPTEPSLISDFGPPAPNGAPGGAGVALPPEFWPAAGLAGRDPLGAVGFPGVVRAAAGPGLPGAVPTTAGRLVGPVAMLPPDGAPGVASLSAAPGSAGDSTAGTVPL